MNWFNLSLIGWIILIVALALAAKMMFPHMNMTYIALGALALLGIGIITSVSKSKPRI